LGGLVSSTLLDFFVHPALFWCFGRGQAQKQLSAAKLPGKRRRRRSEPAIAS
jgi:hypothetical protein